ncbi:MAG TPA: hypothetical protein VK508_10855 [Cyclobacteriaceae bacterium]|nr:hypothetical protein [Cyclobacteriaceae bacterium]
MRKSFSIIFLAVYSLSFTECHQVLKLPLLFKHYQEHSSAVDMTFVEFLVMHYETDVPHDDTDMSLPFKSCGHSQTTSTVAIINQKITLQEPVVIPDRDHFSFYQQISPSLLSHDIFQPPKA